MFLLNGRVVVDVELSDVFSSDYPDFSDAYFSYAVFEDTKEVLTDKELEQLTDENPLTLQEMAYDSFV